MTLRELIAELNKAPESQKDMVVKYCGEWEAEIQSFELINCEGAVLLLIYDSDFGFRQKNN